MTIPRPLRRRYRIVHGHRVGGVPTPTYKSWSDMIRRCTNPGFKYFYNYGGRGIKVCDAWLDSFANFLADMGERPPDKTLDRFPNKDGDYEPGNCRWATKVEQTENRRSQIKDLSGRAFNRWTVLSFSHVGKAGNAFWNCRCACGSLRNVLSGNLLTGHSKSCGCLSRRRAA